MQYTALNVVSLEIGERLAAATGKGVYIGPLHDNDAKATDIVLFLYRVAVNAHLRNAEHRVVSDDPAVPPNVYRGSLPLDLHYLVTAGNRETGGEEDALGTLGRVMQVLNDSPDLVGRKLQGETVRLTLDPIGSEEMSRIWTLFPAINYRTSLVYVASPVWIDPAVLPASATPVVEEPHRFSQKERARVA